MRLRTSLSVISFNEKAKKTWGMEDWHGLDDPDQDVLFFGLYTRNDYDTFKIHKGKKTVFWCGSDILNLTQNYESRRILKLFSDTEHWCENEVEKVNLERCGVKVIGVCPSFLESVYDFPVSFKPSKEPHIFLCGHQKREGEYGWDLVDWLAEQLPEFTFHLYGVDKTDNPRLLDTLNEIDTYKSNIIRHGKVSPEQFNREIAQYQCGLRTNEHDGASEVMVKSLLNGGYPITRIKYPNVWNYDSAEELIEQLKRLKNQKEPNLIARSYYLSKLNQFPWCSPNYWTPKQ